MNSTQAVVEQSSIMFDESYADVDDEWFEVQIMMVSTKQCEMWYFDLIDDDYWNQFWCSSATNGCAYVCVCWTCSLYDWAYTGKYVGDYIYLSMSIPN